MKKLFKHLLAGTFLCLSFYLLPQEAQAFSITSPKNLENFKPGQWIAFNWEECEGDIEQYEWNWTFTGMIYNASGLLVPYTTTVSGENDESGWHSWDPDRFIPSFQIPCNWYSGAFTFHVRAQSYWGEATCGTSDFACTLLPALTLTPPPLTLINCETDKDFKINSTPPISGYVTYWFDQGGNILYKGNEYKRKYPVGLTLLQYMYVTDNAYCANDNYLRALPGVKSLIAIYTAEIPQLDPIHLPDVELNPNPDPRTGRASCTDPGTSFILPGDNEVANILEAAGFELAGVIGGLTGSQISATLIPHVSWTATDGAIPAYHDMPGGIKQVCYEDLDNNGGRCRTYKCLIKFEVKLSVSKMIELPDGTKVQGAYQNTSYDCIQATLVDVKICQRQLCAPNWVDGATIYKNPQSGAPETFNEQALVCPEGPTNPAKTIGPVFPLYENKDYSVSVSQTGGVTYTKVYNDFKWYGQTINTVAQGLSSTTIRNPLVHYASVPVADNMFYKYILKIKETTTTRALPPTPTTVNDPTEQTIEQNYVWNTLVYKCKYCVSAQRPGSSDEEDEVIFSAMVTDEDLKKNDREGLPLLHLYPNPAANSTVIEFEVADAQGKVMLMDYTGRILKEWILESGSNGKVLELADLPAGMYICTLQFPNRPTVSKPLVVMKQ